MTPEELKAYLMAQAEAMIDDMLARKPNAEDITLSDIEQLAIGGGREFREAVLKSLAAAAQPADRRDQVSPPAHH